MTGSIREGRRRLVLRLLVFVLVGGFVAGLLGAVVGAICAIVFDRTDPRRLVLIAIGFLALSAVVTVLEAGGPDQQTLRFALERPLAALAARIAGAFFLFGLYGLVAAERAGAPPTPDEESAVIDPDPAPPGFPRSDRPPRRFWLASTAGAIVAALIFGWVVSGGQRNVFREEEVANFYDLQAHSLLDLRWNVPDDSLGIEAFVVDGRSYTYFGPTPALLRLPIAAVTDELDGHLARVAMGLAFALALVYAIRLHAEIRSLLRGDAPVSGGEALLVALFTAGLGSGSVLLFLGSRAWVYHEAVLWGVAFALASFFYILRFAVRPLPGTLILASVTATLSFLSRGSVGAGPVLALALLAGAQVWTRWRGTRLPSPPDAVGSTLAGPRRLGLDPRGQTGWGAALLVAAAVPAALYMYVNWSKFGTLVRVPYELQIWSSVSPNRRQTLAANDGSLFGFQFVPTHLFQMLRPDALSFDRLFPWITFPEPASVIGDARFDRLDHASSMVTNSPMLFVLAVVGVVSAWRRSASAGLSMLRIPLIAATIGSVVTLTIAFVAYRYQADAVPLLAIAGAAGLHVVHPRLAARWADRRWLRRGGLGVAAGATAFAMVVSVALATLYQRQFSDPLPMSERAAFLGFQYDVHERLGGGGGPRIMVGDVIPPTAPPRSLLVLGECDGLYWFDGHRWFPIEQTNETGRFHLDLTLGDEQASQPLLATSVGELSRHLLLRRLDEDHVAFAYVVEDRIRFDQGATVALEPGAQLSLDVEFDALLGRVRVSHDGDLIFAAPFSGTTSGVPAAETSPSAGGAPSVVLGATVDTVTGARPELDGVIHNRPLSADLCSRLRERLG